MQSNLSMSGATAQPAKAVSAVAFSIADRINEAHFKAQRTKDDAIRFAIQCGELLREQKKRVKHGEFMSWIAKHCPEIQQSTANRYMKAAEQYSYGVEISSLSGVFPSGQKKAFRFRITVNPGAADDDHDRDQAPDLSEDQDGHRPHGVVQDGHSCRCGTCDTCQTITLTANAVKDTINMSGDCAIKRGNYLTQIFDRAECWDAWLRATIGMCLHDPETYALLKSEVEGAAKTTTAVQS